MKHSTADNYEHFLSYMWASGARHNSLLCKAYFDGADAPHEEYEAYMAAHPESVQEPVTIANNAPNLFGQVYLTCRAKGNSHEGSLASADEAVRLHGDDAVSQQDLTLIVEQIVRG